MQGAGHCGRLRGAGGPWPPVGGFRGLPQRAGTSAPPRRWCGCVGLAPSPLTTAPGASGAQEGEPCGARGPLAALPPRAAPGCGGQATALSAEGPVPAQTGPHGPRRPRCTSRGTSRVLQALKPPTGLSPRPHLSLPEPQKHLSPLAGTS